MTGPGWKRRVGTGLLLFWMAALVMAAWPRIVRPALLDFPHDLSVSFLRLFGMSAGQPLFQTDVSPWKQHGYCLFVRERAAGASDALLFPPGGACRIEGFHPRLPPVNRATHRMLSAAWPLRDGEGEAKRASDAYLQAIGRAFCLQGDPEARPAGVEAVWIWYYRNYDDASVLRRNGVYFDYSCETGRLDEVVWHPEDALVLARWGRAAW